MAEWSFFYIAVPASLSQTPIEDNPKKKKTFTITRTAELNYNSELPTHLKFTHGTGSQSGCPANQYVRAHACMHYAEFMNRGGARIGQWCVKRASRFITSVSGGNNQSCAALGIVMAMLPIHHEVSLCDSLHPGEKKKSSPTKICKMNWTSTKQTHVVNTIYSNLY